ncbi:anti-phage ZorAB system protein ZorA [Desulfobacter sp.]|uniref:anti-phage ZorAB system protein ZorA n=1 Tax=Desulfobacter sp. TaxID=2294 RepID=UPI00257EA0F4|nr:anti-phage ZorAB system protein ZorA [Desulfobacter sp.]
MNEAFSLWNLFPDFKEFVTGNLHSAEWLTALFIIVLLVAFIISFFYALTKCVSSSRHIRFYKQLLRDLSQEQLASRQRELTQKALSDKREEYGKLWKEFDETLVFSPDGSRIFNTLDAAHFFNTGSLSKGLTENRLLAAVPGFFTAIGVIGTFVGLTMGLASLEISQNAGVDVLRQGIGNMISGASVAFLTSVWGVTSSVLFNFFEKIMERYVRKEIARLQNRIDYLYPRINPEQSLVKIVDYNRVSTETLQGLAEKIGDRLQEAITQTTGSIRTGLEDSLNKIMAPAIESLVANAHQGCQQALESLLNRFLEGVGEAGNAQRQMMETSSKDVQAVIGNLGTQMSTFISSIEAQAKNIRDESRISQEMLVSKLQEREKIQEEHQQKLEVKFSSMVHSLVEKLDKHHHQSEDRDQTRTAVFEKQLQEMVTKNNQAIELIGGQLTSQIEKEKELHDQRYQALTDNVAGFERTQTDLITKVESLISLQYEQAELINQGLSELLERFRQVAEANTVIGKEMVEATRQMQGVSNQLGIMATTISQATEKLSNDIGKAAELTANLTETNQLVSGYLLESLEGYQQLTKSMDEVVTKLKGATENAERGFSAVHMHLDEFRKSLTNHVTELDEHIQKLLINYADQVQSQTTERLNIWNTQTNEYISLMTGAVRALNDVVDELETKIGSHA